MTTLRYACTAGAVIALLGCTDDPIGPPTNPIPPGGLTLRFEPVPYDTSMPYITDVAFAPDGSGDAIAIDLYGGFELFNLGDERATVLMTGTIDDTYPEYDAGMLAVAFDPDFADNDYFYLANNVSRARVLVRRYTLDRNDAAATVASAQTILDLDAGTSPRWHNITAMGFDEEGIMWMLVGDKGVSLPEQIPAMGMEKTAAQDPSNFLGALVRVMPSKDPMMGGFTVPSSVVPFSADADPAVVAIGIRSPWKGLYHEGKWIYGEVGLDDIEEINIIDKPGLNFSWPVTEGPCGLDLFDKSPNCDQFTDPWIHYGRSNSHEYVLDDVAAVPTNKRSIYAGWIYKPTDNDPYDGRWDNTLVFGDAFVGFVRAAPLDTEGESHHLSHTPFPGAWGQAPDGYVYMIALSAEPNQENVEEMSDGPSRLYRCMLND